MSLFAPPPPPTNPLGRYRVLSPSAGIRVSPLQLGGGNIGDKWEKHMGSMSRESSFKLLDAYYEAGGNFIDTATGYQDGESEELIGEWMEAKGVRDQMVVATKYSMNLMRGEDIPIKVNYAGNSAKSLMLSVEASLKRLRTSYIDILYLHWWDWQTPVEEVMDHLHNLVVARKVLYLGISDTAAFIVATANTYARMHGKTPFVIYQGEWSVLNRSFEREIIPMARMFGLALAPWNVLAAGKIRSDAEEEKRRVTGEKGRAVFGPNWERNEDEKKMCAALEKVAKEVGTEHITAVAIAYVMQKVPYVFPVIGGRKVEHLMANTDALRISLSDEQVQYLEGILPFDPGFPVTTCGDGTPQRTFWGYESAAIWDRWPLKQSIKPDSGT